MLLANARPQLPSQKLPFGQSLGKCFWQTQSRSYPHKSRLLGLKAAARILSHAWAFFAWFLDMHELASFVCPLVCVRGQGLLRFSVLFKFKFLHGHRLSAPSCVIMWHLHGIRLHAHHHGMLVWHLHGINIARTPSRHARVTPFTASSLHTHETPSRHLVLMMRHRRGIFRSRPAKGVGCLRKSETQWWCQNLFKNK